MRFYRKIDEFNIVEPGTKRCKTLLEASRRLEFLVKRITKEFA